MDCWWIDEKTVKLAAHSVDALATFCYTHSKSALSTAKQISQLIGNPDQFWSTYVYMLFTLHSLLWWDGDDF